MPINSSTFSGRADRTRLNRSRAPRSIVIGARDQLTAGYARATVNRQLQPLQQAFNLAHKQGRLTTVPYMAHLREDNARQGFFEHDEFEAVAANLPLAVQVTPGAIADMHLERGTAVFAAYKGTGITVLQA